jgi:glycosyltransferase involved in cell wall biosynthesis
MKYNKPVRVVHIITRLILAGAQQDALLLVEGLQKKPDYDVYLITGPAVGAEGELISRARTNGVNLFIIQEMQRNISPLNDFLAFVKIYRLIKILKPTIVHTHSSKAGILGRLAAKTARIKIIVHTIYGPLPFHPDQPKLVRWFYTFVERITTKWTNKLTSVADVLVRQTLEAGVGKPEQFQVVRSGIEIEKFLNIPDHSAELRRQYGINESDNVIGVVSILVPRKGHRFLLEIAPRIIERFPRAKFLFVGDGVLREAIKLEALEKGIIDRIIFTGQVKEELLPHLIRLMDVLVHPSLREGLPKVIPEAYLLKKPVVCFDIDGVNEVVVNNKTGYILPPKDTEKLYQAIEILLSNPAKAKEMGERGHLMAKDLFDSRKLPQNVDILYNKLLELQADF